ncbi:MAG: hypothetical protein AAGA54_27770 [Myxococcota bacterium]
MGNRGLLAITTAACLFALPGCDEDGGDSETTAASDSSGGDDPATAGDGDGSGADGGSAADDGGGGGGTPGACEPCVCPDGTQSVECPELDGCLCGGGGETGGAPPPSGCSTNAQIEGAVSAAVNAEQCSAAGSGEVVLLIFEAAGDASLTVSLPVEGLNATTAEPVDAMVNYSGTTAEGQSARWRLEPCVATVTLNDYANILEIVSSGTVDCTGAEVVEIFSEGDDVTDTFPPITIAPFNYEFSVL